MRAHIERRGRVLTMKFFEDEDATTKRLFSFTPFLKMAEGFLSILLIG